MKFIVLVKDPQLGIEAIKSFLLEFSGLDDEILSPHLFNFVQEKAVSHVMRVSAGLDSLVLGEGQILSQVKKWYVLVKTIKV